jgi:molecular chaperone HscA
VKATGGDAALGGDDLDRAIAEDLLRRAGAAAHAGGDALAIKRVLDAARAAKEALSTEDSVDVAVSRPDGSVWRGRLLRVEMEALVNPILNRCAAPVRRAIKDAGLTAADLSGVILVGGATRMPLVRRLVAAWFEREPLADIDPDEVVALGAAIQAELLGGASTGSGVLLLDVVPLSLGLEMMGGVAEKLIHRNTTVPCGATQTFTTYSDNQTGFDLHVVQGERELVADCRSLGRFKLVGIPPLPAGMARLEVTFLIDADGLLRVSARELTTGKASAIEVKPTYGLTDDEVDLMLLDSVAHAEEDVRRKQLAEQRIEAERILAATLSAMASTPELLTDEDRAAIASAEKRLRAAAEATDSMAIKDAVAGLDAASKAFASRRMDRALQAGLGGQSVEAVTAKLG